MGNVLQRFYDEVKIAQQLDFDVHLDTFAACANHLMKRQEALVSRGERDDRLISEDRRKLRKDILQWPIASEWRAIASSTKMDSIPGS